MAVFIVSIIPLFVLDDDHSDSDGDLPKFPSELKIWLYVIAIGTFGALQQFCIIGKKYQNSHFLPLLLELLHFTTLQRFVGHTWPERILRSKWSK